MAKNLGIEYNTDCLFKVKNIVEQSKLNKEERQKNIQGVYELHKQNRLQNKKILLIDDIYTTGSTVNECCKILKQASPKQIEVFTLAKDWDNRDRPNCLINIKMQKWDKWDLSLLSQGGNNGRFSRKYFRLCKVRLYRLCNYDKWRVGFSEKPIFGITKLEKRLNH